MKVQLRRWFSIGLMGGALGASVLVGGVAVGAASPGPSNAPSVSEVQRGNSTHDNRDDFTITQSAAPSARSFVVAPVTTTVTSAPSVLTAHDSRF